MNKKKNQNPIIQRGNEVGLEGGGGYPNMLLTVEGNEAKITGTHPRGYLPETSAAL
jgi:hypothetical protein